MNARKLRGLTPAQVEKRRRRIEAKRVRRSTRTCCEPLARGLRDARLRARLALLQRRASRTPTAGFPEMLRSDSELEAAYRFFNNPRVTLQDMLAPHFKATAACAAARGTVYVLHDSSWFKFGGEKEREGLGRIGKGKKHEGFLGHFALCCAADGSRLPLGLLGLSTLAFTAPVAAKPRSRKEQLADPERKSLRWGQMVRSTRKELGEKVEAIHVMDREADDFALFEQMFHDEERFIIRLRYDRKVRLVEETTFGEDEANPVGEAEKERVLETLRTALGRVEHEVEREVPLSFRGKERPPPNLKLHPPREARLSRLCIRAARVVLPRPRSRTDCQRTELELNVVQVYEPNPPPGETAVEWLLITGEPIATKEDLEAVVDGYRTRWVIEEYFKSLKTGCAYESRQLESLHALVNALGLLAPVAVELLRIRDLARDTPKQPASAVLTPVELQVLRHLSVRHVVPQKATVLDVMLAIAGLGGHLKRNGMPGWLVLHRGFSELRAATAGWEAALASRSDQS